MSESEAQPKVFVSAAEPSADLHASALIRAVSELRPEVRFTGIAGPKMRLEGCAGVYDMTAHSSMLSAIAGHIHHGLKMLLHCHQQLSSRQYGLAVVVDSPFINLQVARIARKCGVPVLYYIAPQLWAWGERLRIRRVRARVDRIACIWPFEEPFFRSYGIETHYVGHPLFERLSGRAVLPEDVTRIKKGSDLTLVIMPGSRKQEAVSNFPSQLRVARALLRRFADLQVLVSAANEQVRPVLEHFAGEVDFPIELHEGQNAELLSAADLALVVSGTVTLEAAYYRCPMIVMYNTRRSWYLLFKWIINTPYFSLPNIVAQREIVPEFMPYYRSIEPILEVAHQLLEDRDRRMGMSAELGELIQPFINTTASKNSAKVVLDMLEAGSGQPAGSTRSTDLASGRKVCISSQ